VTTIASDWNDIGAVVDHIRALRHVDKINLAGWSQGGPRAGGYTAQHPEQVQRLVLLAPAYARTGPDTAPAARPDAVVFNTQSQKNSMRTGIARSAAPSMRQVGEQCRLV
jgi:pimeloyl-ACP methyl ester carboxylesterase